MPKRGRKKKALITDNGRKRVRDHMFLAELILKRPITLSGYIILTELGFEDEVYRLLMSWEAAHIVKALCELDSYKAALRLFRANYDTLLPEIDKTKNAAYDYFAFLRRMNACGGPCPKGTA